ncbi:MULTISPECIES: hypothetical protein [unclassified Pseudoalteromonas]|uniref:hypothetical protein n=1 Tax=unclassified Pseudoalteromonas TaxID=194690 RepID=UPI0003FEF4DE|nr:MULTISPECIES: hypothetical protein [unclassified Pseudoalteromonas]
MDAATDRKVDFDSAITAAYAYKSDYAELSEWGDLPIGVAWGSYSQDVYLLSWQEQEQTTISRDKLIEFLAYIRWHDVKGERQWGVTPEELDDFAKEQSIF